MLFQYINFFKFFVFIIGITSMYCNFQFIIRSKISLNLSHNRLDNYDNMVYQTQSK